MDKAIPNILARGPQSLGHCPLLGAAFSKPGHGRNGRAHVHEAPLVRVAGKHGHMLEAPLMHVEGACTHVGSSICANGSSCASTLHFCEWSFAHEQKHPPLKWSLLTRIELHASASNLHLCEKLHLHKWRTDACE